jgi:DNA polymerase
MFVGEAPGASEDLEGKPFVGAAGKLLTELLAGIGLRREDVYIANVLKCRPPSNRNPEPQEIDKCLPFLRQQVAMMRPPLICTLGNFALKALVDPNLGITTARGQFFKKGNFTFFATFHPAAALYTPAKKGLLIDDFKKLGEFLGPGV